MKKIAKAVAVSLSASILLSACQTTGGGGERPLTASEQRMREQAATYNQTVLEGALLGCLGGGLGGAGIGGATGGKDKKGKNALLGAAVGCAVGGAIGGGVGAYVADKQEKFATKEQQLDAMIGDVRGENQRLSGLISSTQQVIADDKARMDQIDQQLASGKITMEQAKKQIASVDDNRAYLDNTIKELRKRKDTYAEAAKQTTNGASKAKADAMNQEIATLEKQISQLEAERNSLVQRRTVSRVG
jgi:archaellum component FlaC